VNRKVLVPVLVVALLAVAVESWLYFSSGSGPVRSGNAAADEESVYDEELSAAGKGERTAPVLPPPPLSRERLAAILGDLEGNRSPFVMGIAGKESETVRAASRLPLLDGTLIGEGRRVAWVDGRPRREGERFGKFLLSRVEQNRVVVVRDGERFTLEVIAKPARREGTP
jgi:hypothetical protein